MHSKPTRLSPEEYRAIFSKVTRLTVELFIVNEKGILLSLRTLPSWNNQWHVPGGGVLYKETIDEAVKRVAEDELGATVLGKELIGYIEYPSEEKERGYGSSVGMAFLCTLKDTNFTLNEDASNVAFFDVLPENTIKEQEEFMTKNRQKLMEKK